VGRVALRSKTLLAIFDLDISRPGFDDPTVRVSPCEAVVKVRMIGRYCNWPEISKGGASRRGEIGPGKSPVAKYEFSNPSAR